MSRFELFASIVSLTAVLGYLNAKLLRLPSTIGLMAIAMLVSLTAAGLDRAHVLSSDAIERFVDGIDFTRVLMHGMLGFLLFAGALHVDLAELRANRLAIFLLAFLSTLSSTLLIGAATFWLSRWLELGMHLTDALLFGALISPTDPIAVLGVLKSARVPGPIATQISGESLFNDGIGVVLFILISGVRSSGAFSPRDVLWLFAHEAIGGAAFGLAVGYVGYRVLKSIDDYTVEVLITLAIVVGGYAVAERLHVSAPIAAVVSGLLVGNQGRNLGMSQRTRERVDLFWHLLDEMLNAVLFLLLGLQATRLELTHPLVLAMLLVVPLTLLVRFASVAMTVPLSGRGPKPPHYVAILTWGGLRGGISVALALSLEPGPVRGKILALAYAVVAFSILGQGLTLGWFLRRLGRVQRAPAN